MSVHTSQGWPNNETSLPCRLCCFIQDQKEIMDSNVRKKYLLKNMHLVKLNHPGVKHSNDFFILEKEARAEAISLFNDHKERQDHGPRMVYSQRGSTLEEPQRRNVNVLESHFKNRVLGSRYLLNYSAVQTKSCVSQDWMYLMPIFLIKQKSRVVDCAEWLCTPTRSA